ncbi:MAG: replication initiator protein [Microvirus sp.]|nr:MAG: replication initiator protein [Microvirus sp.]
MPCFSPLVGYYSREVGKSGKRGITFDRNASFSGVKIKLPCSRCIGCRLEHSRQWAMRLMHENRLHAFSSFVTLTYRNEDLPPGGTLVKSHFQLFMKRLRKAREPDRIRFYACGEYGDLNARPHYHAILFNCRFPDQRFYKNNGRGEPLFDSIELSKIWPYGDNMIGAVSFDSCAYVARYVMKKRRGADAEEYYDVQDEYGEIFRRIPEFPLMSRRSGLGRGWFDKYGSETYAHDNCVFNGRLVRPPRYYDGLAEESFGGDKIAALKRKRLITSRLYRKDNAPDRLRVREVVALKRLKQLERKV